MAQPLRVSPLPGTRLVVAHMDGRPPVGFRMPVAVVPSGVRPQGVYPQAYNALSGVPAFDWCYGCVPTATAMVMGYYDRLGYANLYAGPSAGTYSAAPQTVNGGVCPLDNTAWGAGECPLAATHLGIDGRAIRGSVDNYYIEYQSTAPDPYLTNGWTPHAPADCTADFMASSQSLHGNVDGETQLVFDPLGYPVENYTEGEPTLIDAAMGWQRFIQSRGYQVSRCYNQLIQGVGSSTGFTWEQYKAEIDAGRPVIFTVGPHAVVAYGYNEVLGRDCYIHDTWDHLSHQMVWGGTYLSGQHQGVTVLQLQPDPGATLNWVGTTGYVTDGVHPDTGAAGATFTFKVRYANPNNVAPSWVRVSVFGPDGNHIAGSPFTMDSDGTTTWPTGVTYTRAVTLSTRGTYSYLFTSLAGSASLRLPATTRKSGPVVNRVPTLAWLGTSGYETDGVQPDRDGLGATFTFQVQYTDADGDPATSVQVRVWQPNGQELPGSPFALTAAGGTPNWTAGVVFSKALSLSTPGAYSYAFTGSDGLATVNRPASGKLSGPTVDRAPTLSWLGSVGFVTDGVHPNTAPAGTKFSFRVKYSDPDGDPATSVLLRLFKPDGAEFPGSPFAMAPGAGTPDWIAGVLFGKVVTLTERGPYTYFMVATGGGATVRLPANARKTGLAVDNAPVLAWTGAAGFTSDGVQPDWAAPGSEFTFRVRYSDLDADPATVVKLYLYNPAGKPVKGSPFTMTPAGGTPNWVAGVVFSQTVKLSAHGAHQYFFAASGGYGTARLPATGRTPGPVVDRPPSLAYTGEAGYQSDGVQPDSGASGSTFTFRIKYSDPDGDAAVSPALRLYLPGGAEAPGSPFAMTPVPGATDWVVGVILRVAVPLTSTGNHSYHFRAGDGFVTLTAPGTPQAGPTVTGGGPTALAVSGVCAQQLPSGVSLSYTLSAPADVRAVILNMAGRIVATVPAASQEAGVCSLLWKGRNTAGSLVPPGLYLVRLEARAADGAAATALAVLQLRSASP